MKKLDGKIAVVTGASKGIGAAIAKHLAAEGAVVVVNYASSKEGADRVVDDITSAGGKAIAFQADVSQKVEVEQLFAKVQQTFGKLDILANNAGIYESYPLENITEKIFHKHFNLNVLGLILTTQQAVKHFDSTGGNIINISSLVSTIPLPNNSVYSATKAAVDAITKSLSLDEYDENWNLKENEVLRQWYQINRPGSVDIGYMIGSVPLETELPLPKLVPEIG